MFSLGAPVRRLRFPPVGLTDLPPPQGDEVQLVLFYIPVKHFGSVLLFCVSEFAICQNTLSYTHTHTHRFVNIYL